MTNKNLSDRNNGNLIKGGLPRCRALTFIVVALLAGNLWGFTTAKDSAINGNLEVTGNTTLGDAASDELILALAQ